MRQAIQIFLQAAVISCLIASCEQQPVDIEDGNLKFGNGVFIVNEGQFLSSNASISFYDPEADSVQNNIFYQSNQVPLGDVAHSMTLWEDEAYIVVNNSGKIYRTGLDDMKFRGKIAGLHSPRYTCLVSTGTGSAKAYVSDLYSGQILVIDPHEEIVIDTIDIKGAAGRLSSEQMLIHQGKLYVACWSFSNQVLVIDISTDQITDSIEVGKQPNSMVLDKNADLWVLSDGGFSGSPFGQEKASLTRVNLENHKAERKKTWDDIRVSPIDLCINTTGDSLYFIAEGVYKVSIEMEGTAEPLIGENGRQLYSLGIDPLDGTVYVGDAVDYQQDGWVYRYKSNGTMIDSFRVGLNPGYFCFSHPKQQ